MGEIVTTFLIAKGLWNVRLVSLSTPPSSVTSGQGNAVVGDAERSQRVGGVAGMVGHRCHTAYVNWMEPERPPPWSSPRRTPVTIISTGPPSWPLTCVGRTLPRSVMKEQVTGL